MVYNLPRSASVRAATPCVIFILERADLKRVLQHYPKGGFLVPFYSLDNPDGGTPKTLGGGQGSFQTLFLYLRPKLEVLYPIFDLILKAIPCFRPSL